MAQYSNLKAYIEEKIYENGTQAITGDILQDVLKVMTDDLGEFYQTGGVASPSTDPGTPDAKVIYFATEAGTYTNFGGITLAAGEVALLIFETSWTKETLNVLSSANGGVKTANLADGAVTTEKIAGGAVETAKIADNAVTSGKVADGAIGTAKIADGAIGADKIAANAVESAKIKNGAVTEGKINDGAVTAGKIASNAVITDKIKDDAVTSDKIANNAVGNDQIASGAVHAGNIADGAVTAPKIGGGAVTSGKIGSGAVTEEKIADGAVTASKIADGAVGSDQLAEGAFSAQNLADGSVTTDKLADDAVTAEKIADGAVTADKFANGSVTTIKLGSGAVTTEKIGDGMVTRQKLADSSVGTSKIIDGAVTTDKVADGAITDAKLENPVSVSQNTITIGGEYAGEVSTTYDVTLHNSGATFASLEALLSDADLATLIPTDVRKGGMSIKFVQTSDNKYVQYFCNSQTFTTDVKAWEKMNLEEEFSQLSQQVAINYAFSNGTYFPLNVSVGETIAIDSRNSMASPEYGYAIIEVNKGDFAFIKTVNNTDTAKAYAITNDTGVVLDVVRGDFDGCIEIPENSKWLIVNTKISVGGYAKLISQRIINNLEKVVNSDDNIAGINDIRNGSATSSLSTDATTTKMIPTFGATKVVIITNRPNRAGCSYRYGICMSQSSQDIGSFATQDSLVGPSVRGDATDTSVLNKMSFADNVKCVNITIREYDDSNSQFLRLTKEDFSGYYIKFLFNNGFSYLVDVKSQIESLSDVLNAEGLINEFDDFNLHYNGELSGKYYELTSATVGQSYSPSIANGPGYTGQILSVKGGDLIILSTKGNTASAKAYAILGQNDVVLAFQQSAYSGFLRIPDGGQKLIANTKVVAGNKFIVKFLGKSSEYLTLSSLNLPIKLHETNQFISLYDAQVGSKLISPSVLSASNYGYYIGKVYAGELYNLRTTGNTVAAKSYALLDSDFNVLSVVQSSGQYEIKVNEDGWLIINSNYTNYDISLYTGVSKTIFNGLFKTIFANLYDIARYNNKFQFDEAQIGQLYAGGLRLGYERNVPRKGSAINVDIDLSYGISDSSTYDEVTKRCVPYLYWNQQKIGTIVLFDETTGAPFIFNKDGDKVFLSTNV